MVAGFLRGLDQTPWVRVNENVEDVELSHFLTARVVAGLAQEKTPGFRFLQLKYLESFDFAAGLDSADLGTLNLVNDIRTSSSKLAGSFRRFQPFVFEIHNNLHAGLVAVAGVSTTVATVGAVFVA